MGKERPPFGALASGRGTDFQSLVDAVEAGELKAEIRLLVCNEPGAQVLARAKRHNIPIRVIDHRGKTREEFEDQMVAALREAGVELVVLAGFMRLLTSRFISAYRNRIINIHPSLLPAFPGAHAQADAINYGAKVSGCTVHFVDESLDSGPIILQRAVPVLPGDTPEDLAARILKEEHKVLPLAVRLFAEGRLRIEGRRVVINDKGLPKGLLAPLPKG